MRKKLIVLAKCAVFVFILFIGLFVVQDVLSGDGDSRDAQRINGFFAERENSLDAVFLGPSTTYASWTAPIAWAEYGITVYSLSSAAQPLLAAEFIIDDARKTQPDALYIINVTHFLVDYETYLHKLLNNYPLTVNKLKMTEYLCDQAEFSLSQRMEYYFPIIRFHERWNQLTVSDFTVQTDEYKSASYYASFLKKSKNVSGGEANFTEYDELSENVYQGMVDLMDYCEKENVKALFIIIPQSLRIADRAGKQNTTVKMLEERGFDVLDLRKYTEEIGLDYKTDFYNTKHLNIKGSIKVTNYLSRYLIENYGFEDKRGDADYSDWDIASEKYYSLISEYIS